MVPRAWVNQGEIAAGVKKAEQALAPDVVRIRYSFGDDWTGDPSIFFKIVLSDDASRESRLRDIVERVIDTIDNEVDEDELGLHFYFNFRGLSELAEMNDPAWA